MPHDPFRVVRDFEAELCQYTGAPYAVTVNSCTMALLLAVAWHLRETTSGKLVVWAKEKSLAEIDLWTKKHGERSEIEIPRRTYVSVPQSIWHAGAVPAFRDEQWSGVYQLRPLPVWDSARRFTSGMYTGKLRYDIDPIHPPMIHNPGTFQCVSFHHSKILGDSQGGAILHDNPEADAWFRRARFDGRTEGVTPDADNIMLGWHCYMSPDVAARLLWKLSKLPLHNGDLPNDDYPELDKMECFK